MSIEIDGFLSDRDIEQVRQQYRKEFDQIFGFITELNQLAQSLLPSIEGLPRTLKNLFASGYFIRGLQNCQAAVLMAERGLFTESEMPLGVGWRLCSIWERPREGKTSPVKWAGIT